MINEVKLNLGCGSRKAEGFVNVDFRVAVKPDVVADVRQLPFKERSINYISASQVIEHISHLETDVTLSHWVGLLKNNGQVFICCPDIVSIIDRFETENFDNWLRLLFGDQDYPGNCHYCGFTEDVLVRKLIDLGIRIKDCFTSNGNISCWGIKKSG